jgi:hypothetical protein
MFENVKNHINRFVLKITFIHYRIFRLCRERDALGTDTIPLGRACAERKPSAQCTRHCLAGKELYAESQVQAPWNMSVVSSDSSQHRLFLKTKKSK